MKLTPFAMAAVLLAAPASAATVLVDFNAINDLSATKTPDTSGNYWNTLTGANGTGSITSSVLIDSANNTLAGVTMALTPYTTAAATTVGTFNGTSGPGWAGQLANSADTGATVTDPLLNQAFAYTDGIFCNAGALGITVNGLAANTTYSFSVYGGRTTGFENGNILAVSGYALTGDTVLENRSIAVFAVTSDATGTLKFNFTDSSNGSFSAVINALAFSTVPEPSTYGLLGAGALGLVAAVKRRRSRAA